MDFSFSRALHRRHGAPESVRLRSPIKRMLALARVRSIRIEAELANWDADAEVDGFELRLYPLSTVRTVVPRAGLLTAQLFGQNITPDQMFEPTRDDYSRLQRWSRRVAADD